MIKEDLHKLFEDIKTKLILIYKPIFSRIYGILVSPDEEWKQFEGEKQSYGEIRNNYFIPVLCLLIAIHLFVTIIASICSIGGDESFWTVFFRSLFQTFLANFLCFTLSSWLIWIICGNPSLKKTYLGADFNMDKVSELIVFPYCIYMLSLIPSLWTIFFFVKYIAVFLSIIIVWKGLKYIVPNIDESNNRWYTFISLGIGVFPIFMSMICIKLIDIIMS